LRQQIDSLGVTVHEHAGVARFADQHTIETEGGLRLQAEKIIICTGGVSRRLRVPGFELTSTHSDAWRLPSVPPSMLVVGAGATGVQVASIFNAYGSESSSSRQAHASYRARMKMYRQWFQRLSESRGSWCMRTSARSILSRRPRRGCE
jgi:pyruvate/2-oxoglutarate dehydrogenase complex dihydrolipoamide dehydrogenase (E3) component